MLASSPASSRRSCATDNCTIFRAGAGPPPRTPGPPAGPPPATPPAATVAPAPAVTQTIADDGFDWGAAAVGAGGAGAVLLLTAAGASAVGHRRHQGVTH